MTQLSEEEKYKMIFYQEAGWSISDIAKKLGVAQSSVYRLMKKYHKTGSIAHARGNGRPKVISSQISSIILQERGKNSKISLRKLSSKIKEQTSVTVGRSTIKRFSNDLGIRAYQLIKKPLLTQLHMENRKKLSWEFIKMDENDVKKTIFTDESKFNLLYSDGRPFVWRSKDEGLKPGNFTATKKFGGGNIMVRACFSYNGVGKMEIINGNMIGASYIDILSRNLTPSVDMMNLQEFIFQQDNDPKHTSKLAKEYFNQKGINLLQWPAQSPDLNPIEHLWALVKSKVAERSPKNLSELKISL